MRAGDGTLAIEENVAADDPRVVVHDAHNENPAYAFALSRLQSQDSRYAPMGVFRSVERADLRPADGRPARRWPPRRAPGDDDALQALLRGGDTWQVG